MVDYQKKYLKYKKKYLAVKKMKGGDYESPDTVRLRFEESGLDPLQIKNIATICWKEIRDIVEKEVNNYIEEKKITGGMAGDSPPAEPMIWGFLFVLILSCGIKKVVPSFARDAGLLLLFFTLVLFFTDVDSLFPEAQWTLGGGGEEGAEASKKLVHAAEYVQKILDKQGGDAELNSLLHNILKKQGKNLDDLEKEAIIIWGKIESDIKNKIKEISKNEEFNNNKQLKILIDLINTTNTKNKLTGGAQPEIEGFNITPMTMLIFLAFCVGFGFVILVLAAWLAPPPAGSIERAAQGEGVFGSLPEAKYFLIVWLFNDFQENKRRSR